MTRPSPKQLLATTFLLLAILLAWTPSINRIATDQVDAGLARSLASFAVARTINAGISVLQSLDLSLSFGAGIKVSPTQILSPLHSLIEVFGNVMLATSVAFGVQRVLIAIGGISAISMLLTVVAAYWLWRSWRGEVQSRWLRLSLLLLLLVKFSMPAVTLASDRIYQGFMSQPYAQAHTAISTSSTQLQQLSSQAAPPATLPAAESMTERMKRWAATAADKLDIFDRVAAARDTAGRMVTFLVDIIVVSLLQAFILPIAFLWLFIGIGRSVLVTNRPVVSAAVVPA